MFLLTILISLVVVAQNGWTVHAIENPAAASSEAVIRSNANGVGAGRSKKDSLLRRSSLRRLQNTTTVNTSSTPLSEEETLALGAEILAEEVTEKVQEEGTISPVEEAYLDVAVGELAEAVEELEQNEEKVAQIEELEENAEAVTEMLYNTTELEEEAAPEVVFSGDPNAGNETTYPEDESESSTTIAANEATALDEDVVGATNDPYLDNVVGDQPLGLTAEAPPGDTLDGGSKLSPSPSAGGSTDELSYGEGDEEEEGEPLVWQTTPPPSPTSGGDGEWEYGNGESPPPTPYPSYANGEGTYSPTPASQKNDWNESSPWGSTFESYPTEKPTPRPTSLYVPKSGDPLAEEEEPDVSEFTDDAVFYHGLGGTVGKYLDGVESPQEMERDKNVQIVAGVLGGLFLIFMLVTAHLVMHYPDGLCAGCCRLTNKLICCVTRTLCLPCRAICCKGSDQSQSRRTHAPMRTPFPSDLELA